VKNRHMLFSRCQLFFIKKREERKGKGEGKGKGKERPPSLMVNIVVLVCFSPLRGECFGKSSARFGQFSAHREPEYVLSCTLD
jgi:hypothetical protein